MQLSVSIRSIVLGVCGALLFMPLLASAQAAGECSFGRTLDVGVTGEDVRCLQQFLNTAGFTVATDGPGSPGSETSRFGSLTEAAVLEWQKAEGIPGANGVFGPQSQAAYLLAAVNVLESQMSTATPLPTPVAVVTAPTPQVAGASTVSNTVIASVFLEALEEIELADDEVEHRILTDEPYADHMRALNKAKRAFFQAAEAYFTGSSDEAYDYLDDVLDYAEDAADDSYKESSNRNDDDDDDAEEEEDDDEDNEASKGDAWDDIDDAWDEYQEVKNFIDDAEEDGVDTDEAMDLLKEAGEVLREAEDAADDKDYDDAVDLADEAQDLLDDAQDAARE